MKRNLFSKLDSGLLLRLNTGALVITLFCEIFVIHVFLTKGQQSGLETWKYYSIIGGLALISILLAISVFSFIYFIRLRKKQNK
ncbi:MAG: hypothetical protein JW798_13440 [Prolixibacteraceae bacterium]|nr:hypothetical protein [Prolixibacteraceae bacterium]